MKNKKCPECKGTGWSDQYDRSDPPNRYTCSKGCMPILPATAAEKWKVEQFDNTDFEFVVTNGIDKFYFNHKEESHELRNLLNSKDTHIEELEKEIEIKDEQFQNTWNLIKEHHKNFAKLESENAELKAMLDEAETEIERQKKETERVFKLHDAAVSDYLDTKAKCESDHCDINDLLNEFKRQGFNTDNWDGDEGAEKAIVDGVRSHIASLQDKWTTGQKDCSICNHSWTAVYPIEATELECPNCKHMNEL